MPKLIFESTKNVIYDPRSKTPKAIYIIRYPIVPLKLFDNETRIEMSAMSNESVPRTRRKNED